jgi:polyisoprenoid-binding protein YceI
MPFLGFSQEVNIDTKSASVSFTFVKDNTKGTIDDIAAAIELNPSDLGKSVISGTANVNALSTGNNARDKHLKSKDFFDAEKYPTMKFTSTEIIGKGENFSAKGSLTIKDVTKEVTFNVIMEGKNMVFETTIYSSDFGVSVKDGRDKNKVTVKVIVPVS